MLSNLSDDPTDAKERQKQEYYKETRVLQGKKSTSRGEKKAKNSPPANVEGFVSCRWSSMIGNG